jgi:hypothetical protein
VIIEPVPAVAVAESGTAEPTLAVELFVGAVRLTVVAVDTVTETAEEVTVMLLVSSTFAVSE